MKMELQQKDIDNKRVIAFQLAIFTVFIKPMAFDHLSLFRCAFVPTTTTGNNKKTKNSVRLTMENVFKMQDIGKRNSVKVTSRKAAPLGDPRGVPKYFRKCFYKAYIKSANKRLQEVILLKFENSVKVIIVKTTSSNFLLTEVKMNFDNINNSDFGDIPNDILDLIGVNPIEDNNFFNELDLVCETLGIESDTDQMQELSPQTINVPQRANNLDNEDQNIIISPIPAVQFQVVPLIPLTSIPNQNNIQLLLPSAPLPLSSLPSPTSPSSSSSSSSTSGLTDNLREARLRNNEASRRYRDAKKAKLDDLNHELQSQSKKNERLDKQEREMRQINETLKRTYMKMVSCGQQGNLSVVSEMVTQLTGRYLSSDQSVEEYQDIELLELDNNEPSDEQSDEPITKRLRFI